MNRFNPDSSLSNMWKAFNAMPSKTTALDRITEKAKSEQKAHVDNAIRQATSPEYIQSKKVDGEFFRRFDRAKAEQTQHTRESIAELRRFVGKGMKMDAYG